MNSFTNGVIVEALIPLVDKILAMLTVVDVENADRLLNFANELVKRV
jgi:hypothetical protein